MVATRRVDYPIHTFSTTWCRISTKISLRTPVPGPGLCLVWSAEHVENAVPVHRSDPPGEDDIESEETGPISIQSPICNVVVAVFQFLPDSYSAHPFSLPQI